MTAPEFHLTWPEGEVVLTDPAIIERTVRELDERYRAARRSVFVGVDARDASLDIGLGVLHAAVWIEGEDDDAYLSRGRSGSPEEVGFEFDGEVTALPASVTIDADEALRVVAEFVATGARPAGIEWQVA